MQINQGNMNRATENLSAVNFEIIILTNATCLFKNVFKFTYVIKKVKKKKHETRKEA